MCSKEGWTGTGENTRICPRRNGGRPLIIRRGNRPRLGPTKEDATYETERQGSYRHRWGDGIGKAISLALASEGAAVVIAARDFPRLEQAAKDIKSRGAKVRAIQADISDHEQVKRMVAQTIRDFGQIDILINNAARGTFNNADVTDMNPKEWHDSLAINLTGTMLCCREVLKYMAPPQKR